MYIAIYYKTHILYYYFIVSQVIIASKCPKIKYTFLRLEILISQDTQNIKALETTSALTCICSMKTTAFLKCQSSRRCFTSQ